MRVLHILIVTGCFFLGMTMCQACNGNTGPIPPSQTELHEPLPPFDDMNHLMKSYHWKSGVVGFSMGRWILPFLRTFIDVPEAKQILKGMRKVHLLLVEKDVADPHLVHRLKTDYELQKGMYAPLIEVNEEGSHISIVGSLSEDEEKMKELIFYVDDGAGDLVILDMTGRIGVTQLMEILTEAIK